MVKLVDAFTKTLGRAPTMKEIDAMHELQRDQKKLQELKNKVEQKVIDKARPKSKTRRRHPVPLRMPKNAKIVNRMMLVGLNVGTIAYCMELPEQAINTYIREHKLPRKIK
jgi:DNA-binding NarL/FixJ family response regulator